MSLNGALVTTLQQLINQSSKASDIDRTIARYLLKNLYCDNITANKIADECHTSSASVTRFAQNLGYEGFSELKKDFDLMKFEFHEMKIDVKAFHKEEDHQNRNLTKLFDEEMLEASKDIEDYINNLDTEIIEKLCELIHEAKHITIYSTLIPGNLSQVLQNMLLTAGKYVECFPSIKQQYEASQKLKEGDLAIFVSLEGSHVMNKELTFSITESNASSVLITHNPEMKLASMFDHIVPLGKHASERSGKYKLLMFIEYLAHFYFNKYC